MKLAFISDIHGNAIALEAVLANINKHAVDKIYVLGDICFRGPEPKRSLDLVRSLETDVIKGNADEWIVRGIIKDEVPVQVYETMSSEVNWTRSKLNAEDQKYLKSLPTCLNIEHENSKIHAFHATPDDLFEVVLPSEIDEIIKEKLMKNSSADIFIYAHIHKPYIRYIDGKCIINIGSVGLPFDGLRKSSYALLNIEKDSFQTSIIRVDYDVQEVIQQFQTLDYPNGELMTSIMLSGKV
ncbi:metallophosphoesterase family protein [Peribacillus muralis]|uniref:metallophosphoesterase family protein n=1 Tax=Peribacillus muralis TaxID=264697 RepID=UPI001F4EEA32|nr:metallophosphoesterase family protein [Peribacillus muralis]MCK1993418.1 metallophosphatase family protein [Peribacillus muralis]MCK2014294.1 metallophosphatase family protein [Peribacillus muralis]